LYFGVLKCFFEESFTDLKFFPVSGWKRLCLFLSIMPGSLTILRLAGFMGDAIPKGMQKSSLSVSPWLLPKIC